MVPYPARHLLVVVEYGTAAELLRESDDMFVY